MENPPVLSQPEWCTVLDVLQDAIESTEETLSEMRRDGDSADEIVKTEGYVEELGGIIAKVRSSLGLS